jgi:ABC-2 type transport system permease protein
MALRISLKTPPGWQFILSVVLLVLATVGAIYASAKIYSVGILMYGKRPSLVEMFRWLRYS